MSDGDEMNELLGRIEEHIQAAEANVEKMNYTLHESLAMSNALLATALAVVEMVEAMKRIEESLNRGIIPDDYPSKHVKLIWTGDKKETDEEGA